MNCCRGSLNSISALRIHVIELLRERLQLVSRTVKSSLVSSVGGESEFTSELDLSIG